MNSPMPLALVWCLLLCCAFLYDETVSGLSLDRSQQAALRRLHHSLAVRKSDWPPAADPCTNWTGVKCMSGGVVSLDLSGLRPRRRGRDGVVPHPRLDANALRDLPKLNILNASGYPLPGPIPPDIVDVSQLTVLVLSGNSLNGTIPSNLSDLRYLLHLDLSHNSLSGRLPLPPRQLRELILSNNTLTGPVPAELSRLSSLIDLDLSFNLLSGALPDDLFSSLSRLRSIKLNHNQFTSVLPNSLLQSPELRFLDLSSNNLTGELRVAPTAWDGIRTQGSVFNLSNNLLYGLIPDEFSTVVRRFGVVDLSSNYFNGKEYAGSAVDETMNCFSGALKQRPPHDCENFYMERSGKSTISSVRKRSWRWWFSLVAIACGLLFLAVVGAALALCIMRRRKNIGGSPPAPLEEVPPSSVAVSVDSPAPVDGFSFEQLMKATSGFCSTKLIKNGHSGDLYHGVLEDGVEVVVKRIDPPTMRREAFLTEMKFFEDVSGARFVPYLGRCLEKEDEKLLVYKYMSNGDLSGALHNKSDLEEDGSQSLDWIKRLKIATGIAEALCCLHHESNTPLVHRDIETSSILLDDKYEVRLGSLGEVCPQQYDVHQNVLSRILKSSQTFGRGSPGSSSTSTCAYDMYCFGKVLLELITGKDGVSGSNNAATNKWLEETVACISMYDREMVSRIVDSNLMVDEDHMEEVWAVAVVAKSCLDPRPAKRPLARHVLKALESPLKVVREVNYPSISSSRSSWHSALIGGWLQSFTSIVSVRPVEGDQPSKNLGTSTVSKSHSSGEDHHRSSAQRG